MIAASEHHKMDMGSILQEPFFSGAFDAIVGNTTNVELTAPLWPFVVEHVARVQAVSSKKEVDMAVQAAEEAEQAAAQMVDVSEHKKQHALRVAFETKLHAYNCSLKQVVPEVAATSDKLAASSVERHDRLLEDQICLYMFVFGCEML
jgi:D-aminopeptidase